MVGEFARYGEADAGAGGAFGESGVKAGEGGEDALASRGGDAGAVVAEGDEDVVFFLLGAEEGALSVGGVFFDVRKEVAEDLLASVGVGDDLGGVGEVGFDCDAGFGEGGGPVGEDVVEGLVKVERLGVELELFALGAGKREDVVDEAGKAAGLGSDDIELLGGGVVGWEGLGGELGVEADVGEGRFEFVADLVDEGDTAGGFTEGAVVFAQEPEGDDEEGEGEGGEVEEDGFGEAGLVLGDEGGVVLQGPGFEGRSEGEGEGRSF